jgi:hypothetical protein
MPLPSLLVAGDDVAALGSAAATAAVPPLSPLEARQHEHEEEQQQQQGLLRQVQDGAHGLAGAAARLEQGLLEQLGALERRLQGGFARCPPGSRHI